MQEIPVGRVQFFLLELDIKVHSNEVNIKWRQMHWRNHWTGNISNGWRGWIKNLFNYCQWKKRNLQCNSTWMQYWTTTQTNCRKKKNSFKPGFSILTNIRRMFCCVGEKFAWCPMTCVKKLGNRGLLVNFDFFWEICIHLHFAINCQLNFYYLYFP